MKESTSSDSKVLFSYAHGLGQLGRAWDVSALDDFVHVLDAVEQSRILHAFVHQVSFGLNSNQYNAG